MSAFSVDHFLTFLEINSFFFYQVFVIKTSTLILLMGDICSQCMKAETIHVIHIRCIDPAHLVLEVGRTDMQDQVKAYQYSNKKV